MTADLPESVADMLGTGSRCPSESTTRRTLGDIDALAERPQPDQRPQPSPRTAHGLTGQDDCWHIDILPGGHGHLSQVSGLGGKLSQQADQQIDLLGCARWRRNRGDNRCDHRPEDFLGFSLRHDVDGAPGRQVAHHPSDQFTRGRPCCRSSASSRPGMCCTATEAEIPLAGFGVAGRTSGGLVGPRRRQFRRARHRCAGRSGRVNWASTPEGAGNADICGRLAAHGRLETIASACLMPRLAKT